MNVQKIGLNFKISSSKIKDVPSSKAISPKEDELRISRNSKGLQTKNNVSQVYVYTGAKANTPGINLLNPVYTRHKIESGKINNLRNLSKSNSPDLKPVNNEKITSSTLDVRKEKIEEAKARLAQGYYSRAEVYSRVAERILDILI